MNTRVIKVIPHAVMILLIVATVLPAGAAQRVALVIGNSQYESAPLANPVNDATDMAAALTRLGFTVILKKNASQEAMEEALEDFGNRLKRGGVGLFFYAGHGIQANGANYLIPVGARLKKESDLKYRAIDAGRILDEMQNANNGTNIVILDACRDNPFSRSFRSAGRWFEHHCFGAAGHLYHIFHKPRQRRRRRRRAATAPIPNPFSRI